MKKSLLVIEQSQVLMDLTRKILEREGYSVRCAVGIAGAVEMLGDFVPDGIILENDLPDGKGIDLCRELRKQNNVPVLLVSGNSEDELPALQTGANDYIKKPYDYAIMKARVSIMLNTAATMEQEPGDGEKNSLDINPVKLGTKEIQSQTPGADAAGQEWDKKPEKNKIYFIAAMAVTAMLIFAAFAFWMPIFRAGEAGGIEMADPAVPLAAAPMLPDENAVPCRLCVADAARGPGYLIPQYSAAAIAADGQEMQITLFNPEGNTCHFIFSIELEATGEPLYTSGLVAPGMCLENITLSATPEKGEHNAILNIRAYDMESQTQMTGANINFTFTAK